MSLVYNKTLGVYFPSFMLLRLNVEGKIEDLNNMSDKQKAIFSHEYIHFLQDITTTYGLRNCIHIVDILKTYVHSVSADESFSVPIKISNTDPVGLNIDLESLYRGDVSNINSFDIKEIKIESNNLIPGYEKEPHATLIDTHVSKDVMLGSYAIIESMAYLIESLLYPGLGASDYPYGIVEKVVKYYYPELLAKKSNLVALCDAALMCNFNCGPFLCDSLRRMRDESFLPDTEEEIYEYMFNGTIQHNGQDYTIVSFYEHMSQVAEKQLNDYFTSDHTTEIISWISDIFRFGRELRINNNHLFANMTSGTVIDNRKQFSEITRRLGTPLIIWPDGRYSIADGMEKYNIQLFAAIRNVYLLFSEGRAACDMTKFCINESDNIVDENCMRQPWEKVQSDRLCPYAQVWKMWGLKGKTPVST